MVSDDDSDDSDGGKHRDVDNVPGDYPTADDLDVMLSSKMWTKVGSGTLAETGLSPPRLIREEEAMKASGKTVAEAAPVPIDTEHTTPTISIEGSAFSGAGAPSLSTCKGCGYRGVKATY